MAQELVRIYDRLADAQQVRESLLASGFSPSRVHLDALDDEAGPVEGNFVSGNGRDIRNRREDLYEPNFSHVVQRGTCLLTVEAEDEGQRQRACEIMDCHGAHDIDGRRA